MLQNTCQKNPSKFIVCPPSILSYPKSIETQSPLTIQAKNGSSFFFNVTKKDKKNLYWNLTAAADVITI